ncbi:unnamed protein product [Caenorhabditis nigoni]
MVLRKLCRVLGKTNKASGRAQNQNRRCIGTYSKTITQAFEVHSPEESNRRLKFETSLPTTTIMPILNKVVPTSVKTKVWDLTGISNQDVWKGANEGFKIAIHDLLHLSTIKIHWTTFPPRISIYSDSTCYNTLFKWLADNKDLHARDTVQDFGKSWNHGKILGKSSGIRSSGPQSLRSRALASGALGSGRWDRRIGAGGCGFGAGGGGIGAGGVGIGAG